MNPPSSTNLCCPECRAPLSHTAPRGLCTRCLVSNSLSLRGSPAGDGFSLRSLEELNQVFPDYEIRRLLGRGGMGAVYEAWQKSLSRAVALKLLPPELLRSEDFFDRFQREARIMAQMDHPNVARVFDSGLTDDGEAYIVMELVNGKPITPHASSAGLNLRERLELFEQVCRGVQHAHQKGVIHRDLKPSNILVAEIEGRAVPKVIDFGLAKPLAQSTGDDAVWLSSWHAVGTPAYMSPEQAAGQDVDSRSDIYSLGALLYELLTGRTFLDDASLQDATRTTIEATIRHALVLEPSDCVRQLEPSSDGSEGSKPVSKNPLSVPPFRLPSPWRRIRRIATGRPSLPRFYPLPWRDRRTGRKGTVVSSDDSSMSPAELKGDLDAIVLKALDKDPTCRYETVAALSDDLQRHLTHQPVLAVPPSAFYLLGKYCRRHRVSLAIAMGFVAVLLAGFVLVVRGSVQARSAERLAAERLQQGERLIEFILGDLQGKLATVGRLDILESAVGAVESFYAQPATTTLGPESLRNRAHARLLLGRIRNSQGSAEAAKAHYEESIRLYRAAVNARPNLAAWHEELGRVWNSLAAFHHSRGDMPSAETAYLEALHWADQALRAEPNEMKWADFKASVLHNLAVLCMAFKRFEESKTHYTEALQLWEPLLKRAPENTRYLENLSHLYLNLAFQHQEPDVVDRYNAEALRLRQRLVQLDTNNSRFVLFLADAQQNIGEMHSRRGRLDEAEHWLNQYRPLREQLAARDPGNAEWQHALADAWRNDALLQTQRENFEAAAAAHRKAWEISERRLPAPGLGNMDTPRSRWADGLRAADRIFAHLARRAKDQGHLTPARDHLKIVVEIRAKLANETLSDPAPKHELATGILELAAANLAAGDPEIAKQHVPLALLLLDHCHGAGHTNPLGGDAWKALGELVEVPANLPQTQLKYAEFLRNALAGTGDSDRRLMALDEAPIHLPQALLAELRQWAVRGNGRK